MHIFDLLAERRIVDAIGRGELDGLPGVGRPLPPDGEDPLVPAEIRMLNRVLKNAGWAPAQVGLRREIAALRSELAGMQEGARLVALQRRLAELLLRLSETGRV